MLLRDAGYPQSRAKEKLMRVDKRTDKKFAKLD